MASGPEALEADDGDIRLAMNKDGPRRIRRTHRTRRALLVLLLVLMVAIVIALAVALPVTLTNALKPHSVKLRKATSAKPWFSNSSSSARRRRLASSGSLEGAAWADYSAQVNIGSQTFDAIIDTGSATFAVAASSADDCYTYYAGTCGGEQVSAQYGSGSWKGQVCGGDVDVSLEGLSAGTPQFAGIEQQVTFLNDCTADGKSGIISEGIIGMAYQSLTTLTAPNTPFTPLFDSVVATSGIDDIFALQCCGWDGGSTPGTGTLTLGGTDQSLYTGGIQYTPITKELYYCVWMTGAYTTGGSPPSLSPAPAYAYADPDSSSSGWSWGEWLGASIRGRSLAGPGSYMYAYLPEDGGHEEVPVCATIIDSGTSALVLTDWFQEVADAARGDGPICTEAQRDALPNIVLTFWGDVTLTIPPKRYYQFNPSTGCYEFLVEVGGKQNIIGQVMMEQYYTIFDRANKRIGFAEIAGCT